MVVEIRDWCQNVGEYNTYNFCIWHFGLCVIVSKIDRCRSSDPPIWNCDKSHFSQLPCIRRHNSVISQPITMKFGTHTGGAAGEVCHLWLPCYRLLYSYRAVITWVYIGFVNRGFEILWCEYSRVATFPCGGLWVLPQENLEISSALGTILGYLGLVFKYNFPHKVTIFSLPSLKSCTHTGIFQYECMISAASPPQNVGCETLT